MFKIPGRKKTDSALKHRNNREHRFLNMDMMKRVLILFNYEDWYQVKEIVQDMEAKGKEVLLWTIEPKKGKEKGTIKETPSASRIRIITTKEISWFFGLSPMVKKEFEELACDTLLDLTTYTDKHLHSLLAISGAQFCIGIKELDDKIYDFTIIKEEEKDLLDTYNQIKFYLNNIR